MVPPPLRLYCAKSSIGLPGEEQHRVLLDNKDAETLLLLLVATKRPSYNRVLKSSAGVQRAGPSTCWRARSE